MFGGGHVAIRAGDVLLSLGSVKTPIILRPRCGRNSKKVHIKIPELHPLPSRCQDGIIIPGGPFVPDYPWATLRKIPRHPWCCRYASGVNERLPFPVFW